MRRKYLGVDFFTSAAKKSASLSMQSQMGPSNAQTHINEIEFPSEMKAINNSVYLNFLSLTLLPSTHLTKEKISYK